MNIQSIGSRTRTTAAVWTASLALGALTLTACASGVAQTEHPADADTANIRHSQIARVPAELRGSTPDQIDRALARIAAEQRALAERFAGVPADRIEEQLAREARG